MNTASMSREDSISGRGNGSTTLQLTQLQVNSSRICLDLPPTMSKIYLNYHPALPYSRTFVVLSASG